MNKNKITRMNPDLLSEFDILKERFFRLSVQKERLRDEVLCCFVKSPLEATAESIGSVINSHAIWM